MLFCVSLSPLIAANPAQEAKAKELISLMEIEKNIDASVVQITKMMDGMIDAQGLDPESAKVAKEISKKSMESSFKQMKQIDWVTMFGSIYSDVFTVDELQGIIDFYKSPVGKKMLEKQPELTAATMQKMQAEMAKFMPQIQADVQKALEEAMKETSDQ
jgi:hypothetical protein